MKKQMILVQLSPDCFFFVNWVFGHEGLSPIHDKDNVTHQHCESLSRCFTVINSKLQLTTFTMLYDVVPWRRAG